ncbi:synembryn isoform X2 [Belonocnema kinseyi]|uniref:synembryn isoform X2 n=1 Tax=Belonocnema kinseyi TaxID=2817044 RepID=UPI00143CFC32|nr:synembryn isoform X2 [Belonocnema kinseyi]
MDDVFYKIITGNPEEVRRSLERFSVNYGNKSKFEELNKENIRLDVWEALFRQLSDETYSSVHSQCLATLRILSRDKTNLDDIITKEKLNAVLKNAGLAEAGREQSNPDVAVTIEAQKLLCNLLFNSINVQKMIVDTTYLTHLIKRYSKHNESLPHEMKLFDIRILFLTTALNVPTRSVVRDTFLGDTYLIKMLQEISNRYETIPIKEDDVNLACEILKTLFNLYIQLDDLTHKAEEKFKRLVSILRRLTLSQCETKKEDLCSNIVNLLTVIPPKCYSLYMQPVQDDNCTDVYDNMDMSAVSVLLRFLDLRLEYKTDLIENLCPIVTCLIRLAKGERLMRKFMRLQILPPLKDVMKRPEEGTSIRAKLCQYLTSPITELRDLIAELLFIICKENVSRMIKYTGYGNAAGLFANKGLLGRQQPKTEYSSESDDSETEEYTKYKEQINPVTGCYEKPKPNPLEGMSEEQKEYEAMQLVGLVDKLTREGVVHPCTIGEDGKPKPIGHVLELQNELPKQ